ncbi:MAG: hypothetical protein ACE5GT_10130, partial [Rhodospirillales bacterium]
MFGIFGDRSAREVRRLNKDALEVVEYAYQCFRSETVRAIAIMTGEHLTTARQVFEPSPVGLKRAIVEYERRHKEAGRQRDDVLFTAFTLVLIYLRAEAQG